MIRLFTQMLAVVLIVAPAQPAMASEERTINLDELLPEVRPFHDPFAEMGYEQIGNLARLFRMEGQLENGNDSQIREEADNLRSQLIAEGLDPDDLFRQREVVMTERRLAATSVNPDLNGTPVRMPGYILPLEMTGEKAVQFLLVPYVGACIHTPTPPANQMVFVSFEDGFTVDGLYEPVWIRGEMRAQSRTQTLSFVDGQAEIETSYAMQALSVEPYTR